MSRAAPLGASADVADDDPAGPLQLVQGGLVGRVRALAALERHRELLAGGVTGGPRGRRVPHDQPHVGVDEAAPGVPGQRAGQQVRLAQDLEAVADAEHREPRLRRRDQLGHHRGEAGDRAASQVVAVGEAAGEDHRVHAAQVPVGVPERDWHRPGVAHGAGRIGVVEGARECDNAYPHVLQPTRQRLHSAKCPSSARRGGYALRASGGSQAMRLSSTTRVPRPGAVRSVTSSTQALMIANPRPDSASAAWSGARARAAPPRARPGREGPGGGYRAARGSRARRR